MATAPAKSATIYRMVMPEHTCPYGLKAKDLLRRQGYAVEDHWLRTREEIDAFKAKHGVKTTPQTFIAGERVGGFDDLRRFFGKSVRDSKAVTYRPVIAVFAMTALMALAASYAVLGTPFTVRAGEWFIAFSMCVLALLKLQNIESFSSMFLNYDLLAKRWVPYSYLYPFAEGGAGVLMAAGALTWLSVPVALVIGTIFMSYSHQDAAAQAKLNTHLAPWRREGVTVWYDENIEPGAKLSTGIARELRRAHIFVALFSPAYIDSHYCWDIEYKRAMSRRARKLMRVVAVVVKPCGWKQTRAAGFKLLPKDGIPPEGWSSSDAAYVNVAQGIGDVIKAVRTRFRQRLSLRC